MGICSSGSSYSSFDRIVSRDWFNSFVIYHYLYLLSFCLQLGLIMSGFRQDSRPWSPIDPALGFDACSRRHPWYRSLGFTSLRYHARSFQVTHFWSTAAFWIFKSIDFFGFLFRFRRLRQRQFPALFLELTMSPMPEIRCTIPSRIENIQEGIIFSPLLTKFDGFINGILPISNKAAPPQVSPNPV